MSIPQYGEASAFRWQPDDDYNRSQVIGWLERNGMRPLPKSGRIESGQAYRMEGFILQIYTPTGVTDIYPGDWIARTASGQFLRGHAHYFERTSQ